jgi:Xaa-Pro aminopeptidase
VNAASADAARGGTSAGGTGHLEVIPPPAMADRLRRCRELLAAASLDAALITDPADVRYLSGYRGEDAALVVGADVSFICTDSRYTAQVREEVGGFAVVETRDLIADSAAAVAEHVASSAALGFQGTHLSHAAYLRLRRHHRGRLRDVRGRVSRLRIVKDAHEIALLRRAARITEKALQLVVAQGLVGRTEAAVAWALVEEYHRLGADGEAFPAIVAAGDHAAHAHALPCGRVILPGELVVIDTGARVDGYCSDITRTFAAGEPSARLRDLYEVVLTAQLAGVAAVRPGADGHGEVDAACRRVIAAAGYGDHFGHGTGHGVGLEVHEAPLLGRLRGDVLAAGMSCTVEPGIYFEGIAGIRIEDTLLVTPDGCERLTTSTKDLQIMA